MFSCKIHPIINVIGEECGLVIDEHQRNQPGTLFPLTFQQAIFWYDECAEDFMDGAPCDNTFSGDGDTDVTSANVDRAFADTFGADAEDVFLAWEDINLRRCEIRNMAGLQMVQARMNDWY